MGQQQMQQRKDHLVHLAAAVATECLRPRVLELLVEAEEVMQIHRKDPSTENHLVCFVLMGVMEYKDCSYYCCRCDGMVFYVA